MSDTMLVHLAKILDEDVHSVTDGLAMGGAGSYEEYKYSCGIIRGILMAKNHVIELAQRMEDTDD
jgi:hypothetical protein